MEKKERQVIEAPLKRTDAPEEADFIGKTDHKAQVQTKPNQISRVQRRRLLSKRKGIPNYFLEKPRKITIETSYQTKISPMLRQ